MATIVTRTAKGSALTFAEVDGNFTNLNADGIANTSSISNLQNDKLDKSGGTMTGSLVLNSNLTTNAKVITNSAANSQSGSLVTLTTPGTEIVRLTNVLLTSLAGIQAGTAGQKLILSNRSGTTITVENESSSASTSADQISTGTGAAISIQNNASISLIYDGNLSKWNIIGGTGSGTGSAGINYIANPDASIGTTGYTPYNDGTAVPVDGSGGTPSSGLWVRSTVSPLRGSGDFNLVKTGSVSYLGQGVAYDFTIDNADLAKVLTVTFDYEVVSGTYATGDATVYIIQDPAGTPVVIQPAGYQIQSATVGTKMRQIATFQTASNVTSYRLCIHIASASTSDYTLALDNISVGPQVVQYGAPVTDWQSYTPTFTGFGTSTGIDVYWRRVGSDIQVRGSFTPGTTTATEARISLPSGLTTATDSVENTIIGTYGRTATSTSHGGFIIKQNAVAYVKMSPATTFSGANDTAVSSANGSAVSGGGGDRITFEFFTPILGWSSTVQMSNDTDTRVVAARVFKTANQGPFSVETKLTGYTVDRDSHGMWDATNNRFNILVPGDYQLFIQTNGVPATTATQVSAYKINGGATVYLGADTATTGASRTCGAAILPNLKAGDFVEIFQFTSANTTVQAGTGNTFASLARISGPSAIAASETVAASYWLSANQAVTADVTPINYDSREFDSHGAVSTGAAWKFSAPISGLYLCTVVHNVTAGTASARIYKNGTVFRYIATTGGSTFGIGSGMIRLNAGDEIQVRSNTTGTLIGGNLSVNGASQIQIVRVGN